MGKLALGMSLLCLIYIALFLAVSYFNGLLEERQWNRKRGIPNFLRIIKKVLSKDRSNDDLLNAA